MAIDQDEVFAGTWVKVCCDREGRAEGTPRDAFLRPMVDYKGAKDRLGFDARRAAMEIEDEFDENRWESQEALKYGGELPASFNVKLVNLLSVSFVCPALHLMHSSCPHFHVCLNVIRFSETADLLGRRAADPSLNCVLTGRQVTSCPDQSRQFCHSKQGMLK